uniref:hypothetical protein n=1 Tax=uncultured Draconibacterium sp. TaxID=1573823 RepID=UPI003217687A
MKKQLNLTILILSLLFLSNCRYNHPETVASGTIENGVYTNQFFNFQLQIPEEWTVETIGEIEIETDSAITSNSLFQSTAENTKVLMANLLTIFKEDKKDGFKPNFAIIAEHISRRPECRNEVDYLKQTKKQYENVQSSFSDIKEIVLGNNIECQTLDNTLSIPNLEIKQTHYVVIRNDFFLHTTLTYNTTDQKEALTAIINSWKIND